MTDIAGVHTAEIQVQRSVDIATRSVLAEYDCNLKNEYGLFGVCQSEEEMEEKIQAYINRMLNPELNMPLIENAADLYDFHVENVAVELDGRSLNNLIIFENQVLEFMKYRAPIGYLYSFSKEIENVNKASNSLELINRATEIFKELANFEEYLNDIRKYSDGWYYKEGKRFASYEPFIKSIAIQNIDRYKNSIYPLLTTEEKEELVRLIYSENQLLIMSQNYLKELELYIECLCKVKCMRELEERIRVAKRNTEDEKKIMDYDRLLKTITVEIRKCNDIVDKMELNKYHDFFYERKKSCNKALSLIRKSVISLKNTEKLTDEYTTYIDQYGDKILEGVKVTMGNDIRTIQNLIGSQTQNVLRQTEKIIEADCEVLEKQMQYFVDEDVIKHLEIEASTLGKNRSLKFEWNVGIDISEEVKKMIDEDKEYNLFKKKYEKALEILIEKYDSGYSVEPFSLSQVQYLTESNINQKIKISDFTDNDINEEDSKEGRVLRNSNVVNTLPSYLYGVTDNKNMYKTIMSILAQLKGNSLKGDLLRNNLYVNEYILNFFNTHISDTHKKESFFKHETEYILYGKLSDQDNFIKFKSHLLILRSGLNLIHIYSDPFKKAQVFEAAAAVSGGTGTYVLQFIIASAWAEAEAEEDVKRLVNGERVAFIKSKDDWLLSFENFLLAKVKKCHPVLNQENDSDIGFKPNAFSYEDYLRIFLLMHSKEIKLYRALDLIQINMMGRHYKDFKTKDFSGILKVNAEVSIKCRFLTLFWMPEFIKFSSASRKNIIVEVEHGY